MEICDLYLLVLGLALVGDFAVFLLLPRLLNRAPENLVASGGEVRPPKSPVMMIRIAVLLSMVVIAGVFFVVLTSNGCLG